MDQIKLLFHKEIRFVNVMTLKHLTVFAKMFSNVISLVLRNSDTDSESVSLKRRSISNGQKTYSSKSVSTATTTTKDFY